MDFAESSSDLHGNRPAKFKKICTKKICDPNVALMLGCTNLKIINVDIMNKKPF